MVTQILLAVWTITPAEAVVIAALITAIAGLVQTIVLAVLSGRMKRMEMQQNVIKEKQVQIADTQVENAGNILKIEKQTNSIKDALVTAAEKVGFAKGKDEGMAKAEATAATLAEAVAAGPGLAKVEPAAAEQIKAALVAGAEATAAALATKKGEKIAN